MARTTKAQFELFKDSSEKWRAKLGLMNWAFYYKHTRLKTSYAETNWSTISMVATLEFSTYWDTYRPLNALEIDKLSLHEVLHVLLAPLTSEAQYRYSTQEAIDSAEHSIVRSLENIV